MDIAQKNFILKKAFDVLDKNNSLISDIKTSTNFDESEKFLIDDIVISSNLLDGERENPRALASGMKASQLN